ncbi:unnamed protein product, partial [Brenthis ino]
MISDTISNMVCFKCSKLVVQNYLFTKKCRDNLKHVSDFVMNLLKCTESAVETEIGCHKTIFMSKKNSGFVTYFDRGKCKLTSTSACKRFNAIHTSFIKQPDSIGDICVMISPDNEENNGIQNTIVIHPYKNAQNIAVGDLHTLSKENSSNKYSGNVKNQHKPIKINITDILHSESNDNILKCKVCLNEYTTKVNLRKHYIRVHAPKEFKCCKCLRSFGSSGILEKHMYESHTNTICSECGKIYGNIHSLRKHELTHKGSLKCDICKRVYKSRSTFNEHIQMKICGQLQRKSQASAKFQCDICHKKFCHKRSLEGHIRFSHGNAKDYSCSWCSKKFSAISKLRAHEVKHTQVKNFHCKLCGKMLVSKESLLYHTRTHTGEKPYKCDQCGEQFISISRRNEHIHRYHTDATYECDICKQKCKTKANLKKHKRMHFDNINLFEVNNEN